MTGWRAPPVHNSPGCRRPVRNAVVGESTAFPGHCPANLTSRNDLSMNSISSIAMPGRVPPGWCDARRRRGRASDRRETELVCRVGGRIEPGMIFALEANP